MLNLFSQTDPVKHRRERQPVAKYFSSAGITTMEPHMDKVVNTFCEQLEKRFIDGENAGKVCNLGQWILFCKSLLPICL